MNGINLKDITVTFLVFLILSFLAKLIFLTGLGSVIGSFFPDKFNIPIYLSLTLAILITGLATGKLINVRIGTNRMTHALVVAGLAGAYKTFRPDFEPLPYLLVGLFSLLNFLAILIGAYVMASK